MECACTLDDSGEGITHICSSLGRFMKKMVSRGVTQENAEKYLQKARLFEQSVAYIVDREYFAIGHWQGPETYEVMIEIHRSKETS